MVNRSSVYKSLVSLMIFVVALGLVVGVSFTIFSKTCGQTFLGTVHGAGGVAVVGATVIASGSNGSGYATTNAQGQYSITSGLKTGNYTVEVTANGYMYNETNNVHVTAGQATTGINIYLPLSGAISGRVTETGTGTPLSYVEVTAMPSSGSGSSFGFATTDTNGNYTIAMNLATGTYNVSASNPEGHITKIVSGINVVAGQEVKNVNLQLDKSGVIWGRITASPGGQGLSDALVSASSDDFVYANSAYTNATGYYTISSGLGTDTYTVMVSYSSSYNEATGVSVTAGSQTRVDLPITISPSGTITGKVTDTNSQPIPNAYVSAEGNTTYSYGSATTDSQGNYAISTGLATDTYTVTASKTNYTSANTTSVSVTVNEVTSGINFQLSKMPTVQSGTISGTVQGDQNPVPEFTNPVIVLLILTTATIFFAKRVKTRANRTRTP